MKASIADSNPPEGTPTFAMARTVGGAGFFTLAFGCIVGSGWVVVLGEWLAASGPGGAIVGFVAGGLLMAVVAAAYAELVARLPEAGGEFLFVLNGLGRMAGFLTGWFLTLYMVSFTAFEAFALSWFLEILFPALARAPVLYQLLGYDITMFNLGLGLIGTLLLTWFNCHGSHMAVRVQRFITFAFIALSVALIAIGLSGGRAENLTPLLFRPDGNIVAGMLWIFATSLLFLSGFQAAANAVEERSVRTPMRTIAYAMVGAVLAAAAFYGLIILSVASLMPWQQLVSQQLPSVTAFEDVLDYGIAAKLVLIAAIISLAKTWNALHLSASRMVLAQARAQFLPAPFAQVHDQRGVPTRAILFVGCGTTAWLLLGRGAILPIINMSTVCVTVIMVLSLISLHRLRRKQEIKPEFVMPGGAMMLNVAIAASIVAAAVAIISPFLTSPGIPLEIELMIVWAALGIILRFWARWRSGQASPHAGSQ